MSHWWTWQSCRENIPVLHDLKQWFNIQILIRAILKSIKIIDPYIENGGTLH